MTDDDVRLASPASMIEPRLVQELVGSMVSDEFAPIVDDARRRRREGPDPDEPTTVVPLASATDAPDAVRSSGPWKVTPLSVPPEFVNETPAEATVHHSVKTKSPMSVP